MTLTRLVLYMDLLTTHIIEQLERFEGVKNKFHDFVYKQIL